VTWLIKVLKNLSIYFLLVLVLIVIINFGSNQKEPVVQVNYTPEFFNMLAGGQVKSLVIEADSSVNTITGIKSDGTTFVTKGPAGDPELYSRLMERNIPVEVKEPPRPGWWISMLTYMLPIMLIIFIFFFFMQQTQGGGNRVMSFGKSRAKLQTDEQKKVTFNDVAGAEEIKEELEEIVEFLKSPKKFQELGAKIPKGVLLYGPPGTGKTLLARAVAGEAGVPFFSISGSDFVEMFVGVGASRVRDLFEKAKKNAPCIVFVDEIDAVGRQRGAGLGGGHDEREQTLNQLLVEMDGFASNEGIIILAATNRPDILDPALLRPGRFDRQVVVEAPDVNGRKEVLKVHVRDKPLDEGVDLEIIARRTPGFTGADLANLTNEAALLAARKNRKAVTMADLEASIERVIAGPEKKSKVISEKEKWLVCYHEAGHAVVSYLLPNTDPVHKISIIPRGRAGGYTLLLPKEDRYYATKSQLIDQVTMLLGGRVAEAVVLKEISTGAQNDLERSTDIVRKMVMEYGMSDLGSMTFGRKQDTPFLGRDFSRDRNYSEEVASAIDDAVRKTIDQCYRNAKEKLEENLETLHLVARTLFDKETMEADEFADMMAQTELGSGGVVLQKA